MSFFVQNPIKGQSLGNVYVSGTTKGNLGSVNAGDEDAFVTKFDANGTLAWTQQWGTSEQDRTYGVAVDARGSLYVAMNSAGLGGDGAAVSKLDANGTLSWTAQTGRSGNRAHGVAVSGIGVVYLFGNIYAGAGGPDDSDPFLAKFVDDGVDVDFNNDGVITCADVDGLVMQIAAGNHSPDFDLNGDGFVDTTDLNQWRVEAGALNLPSGNPYLLGDANLNGSVDVADFNIWNSHRFASSAGWCGGDFNADGGVDTSDFNIWNSNKFMSSDGGTVVPEPCANVIWLVTMISLAFGFSTGKYGQKRAAGKSTAAG